ncbi:hypothetical protein [Bacillus mojavensis]|uniref:hypothetical protein n=1 Tax=Bacillus mojavensis TaxID=72360 RepID=UPI002DB9549B|nr:hypothetical protein [Bacillus mojavensis]MEC1289490.1 hypothetical protein [Bacillus mojavensis]MEC1684307.1 hypothetical protein [Bacillus mojavensis]MEC1704619.1 hypothetical protein [Bacillus mojavensis]MEC1710252.1 hypothetical protein [Bacillus mojavensis]MEC5246117.1 hypothetical protein [Bacillus mojavensis]
METFYQLKAVLRGVDQTIVKVCDFENERPSKVEIETKLKQYQEKENKFVAYAFIEETFHLIEENIQKADTERG